ncbi:dipeptidase [Metabacillus sp. RGM 3146]|uniref:dipeptidase n=1 Tax=Metabacillus sp. RGM 3146 TaxID=3401092 RepID=UPI003B9AB8D2
MHIFDAHCDLLYKLWKNPSINVYDDPNLHASIKNLQSQNARVQCFAIYVPDHLPQGEKFNAVLTQIHLFHTKILKGYPEIKQITGKEEASALLPGQIGALLTLEGCAPLGNQVYLSSILYQMGIRSFGITWNYANYFADGARETRNAGLSELGFELIQTFNSLGVWTDLSHLNEKSFWDAIEKASHPIASHSNVYKLCPHPRNLRDEQLKAIFQKNGAVGVTFVPEFTRQGKQPEIKDLLNHIDYICSLGGSMHLGFGSDFDGVDHVIQGLENYTGYSFIINELVKRYPEKLVERFLYHNFAERLPV